MREIEKVGVIGAGLMGHALAIVHALGGCNMTPWPPGAKLAFYA